MHDYRDPIFVFFESIVTVTMFCISGTSVSNWSELDGALVGHPFHVLAAEAVTLFGL
jgi:hypothetical protein